MMIFGDKFKFAIETMIEPDLVTPSPAWGRMCLWIEGVPFGDIHDEHCGLGPSFDQLSRVVKRIDSLWLPEFEGMPTTLSGASSLREFTEQVFQLKSNLSMMTKCSDVVSFGRQRAITLRAKVASGQFFLSL